MVLKNARIVTPTDILSGYDILIEDGIIKRIDRGIGKEDGVDLNGAYLTPGFVDIHTHGGYGYDFMDSSDTAFDRAIAFHTDNGTTTILPTSCTAPREQIISFISFARGYIRSEKNALGIIPGIHLEGPYLSEKNRGAQKLEDLKIPDRDGYYYIVENADVIRTVTISPELSGAEKMTRDLTNAGIVVSGGHDDGIYPEFMPAIDAGMSHITHLYCAMSDLRFKDGVRNVGLREYALIEDRLTAEMIADNRHTPRELARLIIRAKGAERVCVVSDSLRCAGLGQSDSLYKLGSGENAQLVKIGDGVAVLADGSRFAGSITPVRKMVKNLIDAGISITDAVRMGSLTPARIIGVADTVGSIEVGKRANLCVLDSDFEIKSVYINGNKI